MAEVETKCAYTQLVDPQTLNLNPRNPNKHNEKQIKLLAKIIKNQGWRSPIVVSTRSGYITKGHGRFMAACELGCKTVPVDYQDYDSEESEVADMIADNRIAELATIDNTILKDLIESIDNGSIDLELTGFGEQELENMFTAVGEDKKPEEEPKKNNAKIECPHCGHIFEGTIKMSEE